MSTREGLRHTSKEITLFSLVIILLSSLLIMLFPAGIAIAGADSKLFGHIGQASLYTHAQ